MTTTDTPPPDACPHCGAGAIKSFTGYPNITGVAILKQRECGSVIDPFYPEKETRTELCREREARQKAEAEVERLKGRMKKAEDLIKGLHGGWKKARKAHLETCKNAQREIDKLHAENVCLQELIQEFYEWSRRDFPTEQEVREIMNRYHDLLNK